MPDDLRAAGAEIDQRKSDSGVELPQIANHIRIREERLKRGRFHLAGEVQLRMLGRRGHTDLARVAIEPARGQESLRTNEQRETQGELDGENQQPQKRSQDPADHP